MGTTSERMTGSSFVENMEATSVYDSMKNLISAYQLGTRSHFHFKSDMEEGLQIFRVHR